MRNYRGRFLIGVYTLINEGETLIALCENTKEFAKFMNITENNADVILRTDKLIAEGKLQDSTIEKVVGK